jgi:hypothetical protein
MSFAERSSVEGGQPGRRPDDLDRLLGDFFAAHLPRHWPVPKPPAPAPRPAFATGLLTRSRLALAASVALLLAGHLWLSGLSRELAPAGPAGGLGDVKGSRPDLPRPKRIEEEVPIPGGKKARLTIETHEAVEPPGQPARPAQPPTYRVNVIEVRP